jgi:hypothetical protein
VSRAHRAHHDTMHACMHACMHAPMGRGDGRMHSAAHQRAAAQRAAGPIAHRPKLPARQVACAVDAPPTPERVITGARVGTAQ